MRNVLLVLLGLFFFSVSSHGASNPFMRYCNKFITKEKGPQTAEEINIFQTMIQLVAIVAPKGKERAKGWKSCRHYYKKLYKLRTIKLSGHQLVDIRILTSFRNIRTLFINNNKIKDLTPLKELKKLRALSIESNKVEDLTPLQDLPKLHHIFAERNPITDLSLLAANSRLVFVDYNGKRYYRKKLRMMATKKFYNNKKNHHAPISCPAEELRLDKGLGFRTFDRRKVSYQYFGNCFSHTAANLIDHHRLSRGTYTKATFWPVSHNYIAMFLDEKGDLDEGGYSELALKVMKNKRGGKFCKSIAVKKAILKMIFPLSFKYSLSKVKRMEEGLLFDFLFKVFKTGLIERFYNAIKDFTPEQFKKYTNANQKRAFVKQYNELVLQIADECPSCTSVDGQLEYLFKNLIGTLRTFLKNRDPLEEKFLPFLRGLLKKECVGGNLVKVNYSLEKSSSENKKAPWVKWIRDKLVNENDPVTIGYCANILIGGVAAYVSKPPLSVTSSSFSSFVERRYNSDYQSNCGEHESAIIGIRKNRKSGRCQFLIRNSWGYGCFQYENDSKGRIECSNGSYWVDSILIHNSILPSSLPERASPFRIK